LFKKSAFLSRQSLGVVLDTCLFWADWIYVPNITWPYYENHDNKTDNNLYFISKLFYKQAYFFQCFKNFLILFLYLTVFISILFLKHFYLFRIFLQHYRLAAFFYPIIKKKKTTDLYFIYTHTQKKRTLFIIFEIVIWICFRLKLRVFQNLELFACWT
jgi:hypothetical protein